MSFSAKAFSGGQRAWVLDTDLGYDPDDILALLILCKRIAVSKEPLLVITSGERRDATGLLGRATAVRFLLDSLDDSLGAEGHLKKSLVVA